MTQTSAVVASVGIALSVAGCMTAAEKGRSNYREFRQEIAAGRFHCAFRHLDDVMGASLGDGEGAASYEYGYLLSATAERGRDEWLPIITDQSIPMEYRRSLLEEIAMHSMLSTEPATER